MRLYSGTSRMFLEAYTSVQESLYLVSASLLSQISHLEKSAHTNIILYVKSFHYNVLSTFMYYCV